MTRSREVSKGATRQEFVYTATSQQTTFSGNDDSSNSLSYTAGQIDVFVNGVRQAAADYTATNGTSVVLGAGASAGDTVNINAFGSFSVADVIVDRAEFDYTATAGQTTFTGQDNDSQTMAYTAGRIDVYLNGSHLNVGDDYTATNGTSVVLESGAQAGDSLVVVSHGTVNLASNILSGDLDLAGNELILDADNDTTITADTDDQIDIKIAGADDFKFTANKFDVLSGSTLEINGTLDANGTEVILDADGDTSITADTDDQIDFKTGGTDRLSIKSDGSTNIGDARIGGSGAVSSTGSWTGSDGVVAHTTSPSLNLSSFGVVVSHTYRGVFFTNSLWNVYDESNVGVHLVGGNTSWTANSDERIKENITELNGSSAYNHVKAARAVTFNWKQEAHNAKAGKKIGFIAQDWETNYPELVEETLASPQIAEEIDGIEDDTKIKGIQYTETVPVLMAALKEAIAKIEVLEAKVAALES